MSTMVDLLDEDQAIAEQKYVCMSFISPERIIKNRDLFMFASFVRDYDFVKSMEKFTQFINYISYKYNIQSDEVHEHFKTFVESEKQTLHKTVEDDFKNFLDMKEKALEEQYNREHQFQTSVRGVKVRGVFPTVEEAELRCKTIRKFDPNHDVYVGPVGIWMPFHPEAYKTGKVEYLEKELNELMHEKKKVEENAKVNFDTRVTKAKMEAIQENISKAAETNNVLTQTINEHGQLVSVNNVNTQEKHLGVNATLDEIRNELFEGEIIRTKEFEGANPNHNFQHKKE